jgi:8-amino-7-oxononanoate synthase
MNYAMRLLETELVSNAQSYKFAHNDFENLELLIERHANTTVFRQERLSMDGDTPNLEELVAVSQKHNCYLVDEAHALGVFGEYGEGLVQMLNLQDSIFRIMTLQTWLSWCCYFRLRRAMVNFARSFIYTTGLSRSFCRNNFNCVSVF